MGSIKIPINKNGQVTLKTAGKYCDRDIDVNVGVVQDPDEQEFWGFYQNYGKRTVYDYAFYGYWWYGRFNPKYDIRPVGAARGLFADCAARGDLEAILAKNNAVLDVSNVTLFNSGFARCYFSHIGQLDLGKCTSNLTQTFYSCYELVSIKELIVREDGWQSFTQTFDKCKKLKEIRFGGCVNMNINLSWSHELSKESILSLLGVLGDGRDATQTVTLSKTAVDKAFTTEEWEKLIENIPWRFSLVDSK